MQPKTWGWTIPPFRSLHDQVVQGSPESAPASVSYLGLEELLFNPSSLKLLGEQFHLALFSLCGQSGNDI